MPTRGQQGLTLPSGPSLPSQLLRSLLPRAGGSGPMRAGLLRSAWPPGSSWTVSPSLRMEAHGWGCDLKIFNIELQFPTPHPHFPLSSPGRFQAQDYRRHLMSVWGHALSEVGGGAPLSTRWALEHPQGQPRALS